MKLLNKHFQNSNSTKVSTLSSLFSDLKSNGKTILLLGAVLASPIFSTAQEFGEPLPEPIPAPKCNNVFGWTNFLPTSIPANKDFLMLCPEYNRVKMGQTNFAKLTVGKGLLSPDQIDDFKLNWTENFKYFKSIELDNKTAIKWRNPGYSNGELAWSHGIVQDEKYGLKFLRSQSDFTNEPGKSSFGIRNNGLVEVNDVDFYVNNGNANIIGNGYITGDEYLNGDLHVGTNAYVCGTLKSTEIIVEANTAWCDYVFEDDYELMSFSELRQYLKENKHLPNVPAASKVETEGINVAQMNVTTMEKVEEMYLYILQLEARVKELEK